MYKAPWIAKVALLIISWLNPMIWCAGARFQGIQQQYESKPVISLESKIHDTPTLSFLLSVRGGKAEIKKRRKRVRKKRKISHETGQEEEEGEVGIDTEQSKSAIKEALKEDVSIAMGEAIRARAADLLNDDLTQSLNHGDMTLNSISYAIGSSELQQQKQQQQGNLNVKSSSPANILNDGGGVQPSSSAVIAAYFLKSHGGLHGIQSIMSFLSVIFGLGTFAVPSTNLSLKICLIQRTLLCALAKHLSGFIAAASASASQIPEVGWRETMVRVESFALDPVAQYLFYCALLVLWTNGVSTTFPKTRITMNVGIDTAEAATTTSATALVTTWWLQDNRNFYSIICLLGPILLREVVSTIWVITDVLILNHSSNLDSATKPPIFLKFGKGAVDSFMSILLTPSQWRNADPIMRQKLLAKLVSKTSLGLEIGTGLILIIDAILTFVNFSISPIATRPSIFAVGKRLICARLYINFMLVRRRKVMDLVKNIRGGFIHVPGRVLDTLLEPQKAMGLNWDADEKSHDGRDKLKTWIDWIGLLTGF